MHPKDINALVFEYEAMSQRGTVPVIEEPVFHQIAEYYESTLLYPKALEVVNHAIAQYPANLEFHIRRIKLLLFLEQPEHAETLIRQYPLPSTTLADLEFLLAETLIQMGRPENALPILEENIKSFSREQLPGVYFLTGLAQERTGAYKYALHSFRRSALLDPRSTHTLKKLWLFVEENQYYRESVRIHHRIIDRDPCNVLAWYNLGQAYYCLEEFDIALETLEYAMSLDSSLGFICCDAAKVALEAGHVELAQEYFENALDAGLATEEIYLGLGKCKEQQFVYEEAIELFELALCEDPFNAEACYRMGHCYKRLNYLEEAGRAFLQAIQQNDLDEESHAAYAEVCRQLGNEEKARYHYCVAAELAPFILAYPFQYISFLLEKGEKQAALDFLNPDYMEGGPIELGYLKIACLLANDYRAEALLLLSALLGDIPEQADIIFQLLPELREDPEIRELV